MNRFPLVLARQDIRRILDRHATRLVRSSRAKRGAYTLQDAHIVRRNERYKRRPELLEDPAVCAVEITEVVAIALLDVDYRLVRACGFHTQRDFFDEWLVRRRGLDPYQTVYALSFHLVEQPRFLHRRAHLGYTTNPALAVRGEPEALSAEDLKRLAADGRVRLERERREEFCKQQARSISARLRLALREGRPEEVLALRLDLERLADRMAVV